MKRHFFLFYAYNKGQCKHIYYKQGRHATNDASIMCSNGCVGCGVGGGGINGDGGAGCNDGGDDSGGDDSGGDDIVAREPQGICVEYFPLEVPNSPLGGGGSGGGGGGGGDGSGGGGGGGSGVGKDVLY